MKNLTKKQKIIIGVALSIVTILLLSYVYSRESSTIENQNLSTYEEENKEEEEKEETTKNEIVVHVAGAVQTEGIMLLQEGDRISNAIEKAGGTTEEADMTQINLATPVEDGMKIYIPKKGEQIENMEETNSAKEQSNQETTSQNNNKIKTKININKATQEELEELPGIGPSTANKIIQHRKENGNFKSVENIKDVSGIGEAKYNSIKDLITV